jgi:hypothetical protein
MYNEFDEPDTDSLQERKVLEDVYRQNMQEIRATVTRGAAGIEASYFCDQEVLLSLASSSN